MTKLNSILFAILYLTVFTTSGQSKIDIGAEGGPSYIFLRGNDRHGSALGFSSGFSFQYNFVKNISLRTGLSYERKGALIRNAFTLDAAGNLAQGTGTVHINYNYLTIPVLVRASFGEKTQFFINAGPYFGYLINQNSVVRDNNKKEKYDSGQFDSKFDTGISTGLGILIPTSKKVVFTIELRNNLGLYNVNKDKRFEPTKTSSTNLLFGLAYRVGA